MLLLTSLFFASPARALQAGTSSQLQITHEFLYYDNEITGSRPESSFLTERRHTADTLQMLYTFRPDSGTAWEGALDLRGTDDPRVDRKRVSMLRGYAKAESANYTATVGDFFGFFSDYTLGKSLKGGQFAYTFKDRTQVTVLAGQDKFAWNDVWNRFPDETVDRQVYGARVSRPLLTDGAVGLSAVKTDENRSYYNDTAQTIDSRVVGLDWSLPAFHRLRLSGESAYSFARLTTQGFDAAFNPIWQETAQKGWAHKVTGRFSYKRFKTVDDYERVSPEYVTTVGAASPDLVRAKTGNTLTITGPWKWIMLNYTYFRNGLARVEGANINTTRMTESGLRYEAPDWRPDLSVELKARHREVTATQRGLRKRVRSVVVALADRVGPLSLTVDYQYLHDNTSDDTRSLRQHVLGLGSNFFTTTASGWKFTQGLRWDLQRDRDDLLNTTDQTGALRANILTVSPWGADAGLAYSRTLVLNALFPGNDRRTWVATAGYNILKKDTQRVELRYRQNDNRFETPGQDYKEMTWELALNNRF